LAESSVHRMRVGGADERVRGLDDRVVGPRFGKWFIHEADLVDGFPPVTMTQPVCAIRRPKRRARSSSSSESAPPAAPMTPIWFFILYPPLRGEPSPRRVTVIDPARTAARARSLL